MAVRIRHLLAALRLWHVALGVALAVTVAFVSALCTFSFVDLGETDWSLPPCSRDFCAPGSTAACRYTDSPCKGKYCNRRCGEWYAAVVAHDGIPWCTCAQFCSDGCYSPTCTACPREDLPLWTRDIPGQLGTGLLCCPFGGSDGNPDPCCSQGHREKYGSCCELEAPHCDCSWGSPITAASFNPASIHVMPAVVVLITLALPALMCCRLPLPLKPRSEVADLAVCAAYGFALFAAGWEAKRAWQLASKPAELLPAGAFGTLAAFGLSVVLLPLDRTHVLFKLTTVPFDRAIKFHRWSGRVAVLFVFAHGSLEAYVQGLPKMFTFEWKSWGLGNAFGTLAGCSCMALLATSISHIRRENYELFAKVHRIFAGLLYVGGSLHCLAFASMSAVCLLLHGASWLARRMRRSGPRRVLRATKHGAAEVDGEAVLLVVDMSAQGLGARELTGGITSPLYAPGAWFLLQLPGDTEWHPYSVAAECSGTASFLVKHMGEGSWSARVAHDLPTALRLEGPYGGPALLPRECAALVLVAGGIGLTPFARLWENPPAGVMHVDLVWIVRSPEAVSWIAALLPDLSTSRHAGKIHIYVTRQDVRERPASPNWAAGIAADDNLNAAMSFSEQSGAESVRSESASWLFESRQSLARQQSNISQVEVEWSRQHTWEASWTYAEQAPKLVQLAAALAWDCDAPPTVVNERVSISAGRPKLEPLLGELRIDRQQDSWGVMACGPQALVADARRSAAVHEMVFCAEEFAW